MDIFKEFATDPKKELEGAWVEMAPAKDGEAPCEALLARMGNRKYGRVLSKKIEENQSILDKKNDEADAKSDQIMAETYAETIWLGARGPWKYKGQSFTYSTQDATKLLLHADYRRRITELASQFDTYRAALEVEQGNV